jgi:type I restriction enzyme, S subunit
MKVRLSDVAYEVSERWNGSKAGVPIVGLEHLEPDELCVRKWDVDPDENTFSKAFKKGQILFGRRRAYQKKLSIATCDGICSGDITVIAAKEDKILSELLPFYLRAERFFDYAIQGSNGSLSPRVKWAHLASYEFELPSLERQRELGEVLWGANRLKEAYKGMVVATDEMLKAKFREMFGEINENPFRFEKATLDHIIIGTPTNGYFAKSSEYAEDASTEILGVTGIVNRLYAQAEDLPRANVKEEDVERFRVGYGDMLFCRSSLVKDGIGKAAIIPRDYGDDVVFECHVIRVKVNTKICHPLFLEYLSWSKDFRSQIIKNSKTTTMTTISQDGISSVNVLLPPLSLQREFVKIAEGAEVTKVNLKKSIAEVDTIIKGLING